MMITMFQEPNRPIKVEAHPIKDHSPRVTLELSLHAHFEQLAIHLNSPGELIDLGCKIANLGRQLLATPFVEEARAEVEIPGPFDGVLEQ